MVRLEGTNIVQWANAAEFQFQNGTIRSCPLLQLNLIQVLNFNSKMVRLEGDNDKGNSYNEQDFNSKMVRLEALLDYPIICHRLILIPKWYD